MLKGLTIFSMAIVSQTNWEEVASPPSEISLLRWLALSLGILAVLLISYKILFGRKHLLNPLSKWVLFFAFLVLSVIVYLINFVSAFERSKKVNFCNSCHVMNAYVSDLKSPESESLAALHYQYRWIADDQCYSCHTDYGIFGSAKTKMSGLRHIWSYYIVGYDTPIEFRGTYNNMICLHCHAPVESFQDVEEHEDDVEELIQSKESCFGAECHVSPHPKEAALGRAER